MDFVYDEEALNQEVPKDKVAKKDEKTNEVFNKLENELNSVYEKATKEIKKIVQEDDNGLQLNLPLDPNTSAKAQKILSDLDSGLANVESVATSYWNKVTAPTFWSNVTEQLSSKLESVGLNKPDLNPIKENESKEGSVSLLAAGNRTEAELKNLSCNKQVFLQRGSKPSLDADFYIDSKTDEISQILSKDKSLEKLMNEIVPVKISYVDFWNIYFYERDAILKKEEKRREILERSKQEETHNEDEEGGWDDEEEDDDNIHSETTKSEPNTDDSVVIVTKEDAEDNGIRNEEEEKAAKGDNEEDDDDDDDDDDDWE
ncbi:hypothetical protein KAFR_0C02580 [Kazachstania africana CBS 2517]|uniref:BSD domain-containing protein n=1 Tax=Kazachstania africana (strain ATCC 22294 / BCRC 22015 / CBS 2517 / CECT 1963 / NBRC 1671 / NRRL Y-8276) TaxID=1071382 RepID=H2ASA1_KAZAF|nr:hypothetical protein KAFR_0C02580 [Kazachstania africana CBS 2517]CCF57251.1 hypothetical protein KAFR_0C02580 [Kazachstania africana CBS 2517]